MKFTILRCRFFRTCISLLCGFSAISSVANAQTTPFAIDSYSLAYPSTWTKKIQATPDGNQLYMFMGPQQGGSMAYCHTTQQSLLPALAPRASKMTEGQRAEFFAAADEKFLFSIYDNLPSAQGFHLIYVRPALIGKATPGFTADFFFSVPQGFVYRVRAHYTFWKKAQLSIWCQTVSKSEAISDRAFQSNLAEFQRFIASVKIKQ